ncbi:MAG TPA: alpha/beta fold hydrolase, partial [Candidatus Elarobacter sp.]|nr:alpha/beta fold hydrolase [Candidatus Elarobacter sp.]
MAVPLAMPKLGMTMREGRVVSWPRAVGAPVEKGEVVLVIESEKAEVEIEAPASGVLRHVYVPEGETVPSGTLLAAITATVEEPFDVRAFREQHDRPAAAPAAARLLPAAETPLSPARRGTAAPITPAARALARELHVDPARIPGTGPGGRVTREDVEAWAARRRDLVPVAEGVALEVPSEGAGDPVVLLPGFGTDVSMFARQIPELAARWRVRGVNPRGVGLSDAPEADAYDVGTAAADVAALLDTPAHVIGASLGAAVAFELALARPALVRSLTLITPFVEAGPRLLAVIDAWCRVASEASPEAVARLVLPWMFSAEYLADEGRRERTVRGLAATAARVPASTLVRTAAGMRSWSGSRRADLAH